MMSWSRALPCWVRAARPTRFGPAVALALLATSACGGADTETTEYCIGIVVGGPAYPDCPTRAAMSAQLVGTRVGGGMVLSVDSGPEKALQSDGRAYSCCYRLTRETSR